MAQFSFQLIAYRVSFDFLQTQGRESIAAKLVANLITQSGADRVLACDLHSGQSMGYFDIPVDHVYGQVKTVHILNDSSKHCENGFAHGSFNLLLDIHEQPVILDYLASKAISAADLVVVSPDVGGVARARAFAKKLSDAPLAIVDKRRHGHNVAEVKKKPTGKYIFTNTRFEIYQSVSCR